MAVKQIDRILAFVQQKNMNERLANQIKLFKSVIKGGEDIFAVRWEKPPVRESERLKVAKCLLICMTPICIGHIR